MSKIPGEELATRIESGVAKILPGLIESRLNEIGPVALRFRDRVASDIRERATFLVLCSIIEDLQERVKALENVGK